MKRLIDEPDLRREVAELGRRISELYRGRPLTVLGVLTGSIVLVADVIRQIDIPLQVAFVRASSYRGTATRPEELTIDVDRLPEVAGRDVLIVDDIFDTGRTLAALCDLLRARGPNSLRSAVLLWKEGRSQVPCVPDEYCFRIPDVFVVGYGLDYDGEYRHLPYIAALEEADLAPAGTRLREHSDLS
jgi:hypoxanthine phosphoribosyltransferase